MKLKPTVVLIPCDQAFMMTDTDGSRPGEGTMVQTNETGARIAQLLSDGTCDSEQSLTDALCAEYDAPADLIRESVRRMVDCLRENGLLCE